LTGRRSSDLRARHSGPGGPGCEDVAHLHSNPTTILWRARRAVALAVEFGDTESTTWQGLRNGDFQLTNIQSRERIMPTIVPNLWFVDNAEEARDFYLSVFRNSEALETLYHTEAGMGEAGSPVAVEFQLDGQKFVGINGGEHDKFNDAISLQVPCETQEEIDYYWEKLTDGGTPIQCGWLKDRFGVSWQITPNVLFDMLVSKDRAAADRATAAMLNMIKLDIAELQQAFEGK
jgi:predicted 3-demethylubiquinone-9 3-methyltransferase (glyoxalase superfamily)